jgi:hypothetical protein
MKPENAFEYVNDFLYFVVQPDTSRSESSLIYCSGVNLFRLLPITKGRHRPLANPARRGLQLTNLGIKSLSLEYRAIPIALKGNYCEGIVPAEDGWYKEHFKIEKAPESLPEKIIHYGVRTLLQKTTTSSLLQVDLPETLLTPDELQLFLEDLCKEYEQ